MATVQINNVAYHNFQEKSSLEYSNLELLKNLLEVIHLDIKKIGEEKLVKFSLIIVKLNYCIELENRYL